MTPRDWACFQCGSRWATDSDGELVESALVETPCLGCERLGPILRESARQRAGLPPEDEALPLVDLSPSANLSRLLASRRETVDYAKRAAGDVE